ncbi:MAG: MBL fold metallo-hydrolase [Acidobacteria bacterium]|nr:MBL fold metallo-hydrolase [Acidobacteriota bacterium]
MISITGLDQHAAWANKVLPAVEEVRSGVFSIPVTFPHNPMRYTLAYLLIGDGEAMLLDPGWDSDQGWADLAEGFAAAHFDVSDLTGIVISHYHPDHLGLAARLRDASGAWVAMGQAEQLPPSTLGAADDYLLRDRDRYISWGVPEDRLGEVVFDARAWDHVRSLAQPTLALKDRELLPVRGLTLRVISTPGHTPGHVCLVDEERQLLFTGDHVLPRITPHLALEDGGLVNPVASYHASLDAVDLGESIEVLPAHEYRFTGMSTRVAELKEHTQQRTNEVEAVLARDQPGTVWEVAQELSWSRGFATLRGLTLRLALAETASHLAFVKNAGSGQAGAIVPDLGIRN